MFSKGFLFYLEYNTRLFFFLLFCPADAVCAIDLDTILPCYLASVIGNKKRVYDAHELFTEQKEIITRLFIQKTWLCIEKITVPKFKKGYTVNELLRDKFFEEYNVEYEVIRNLSQVTQPASHPISYPAEKFIIYQGAVNEGRCFETLIPAMKNVNAQLMICGAGNFFNQVRQLITDYQVEDKVILKGPLPPDELKQLTPLAIFGLTLFEPTGLNQYHSLANRFFDYIMAGIPQICVDYPEYKKINAKYKIGLLIENTDANNLSSCMNKLLEDDVLYDELRMNCLQARKELNWNNEEPKLLAFWKNIFT